MYENIGSRAADYGGWQGYRPNTGIRAKVFAINTGKSSIKAFKDGSELHFH